jgi:hypothetical protein
LFFFYHLHLRNWYFHDNQIILSHNGEPWHR